MWLVVFYQDYIDRNIIEWTGVEEVVPANKNYPLMLLMVMSKHMSSDTS